MTSLVIHVSLPCYKQTGGYVHLSFLPVLAILAASHCSVEQVVDMKQQLNQLRDSLMKSE